MNKNTKARIEREDKITKLIVSHEDKEIAFAHPPFGKGLYREVGEQILVHNLRIPSGDELASLLHAAYFSDKSDEPEFKNIRDIIPFHIWVFNRNLWTNKGVYVIQDPEAKGRSESLNENELEKMLKNGEKINGVRFSKDRKVKFAPTGTYRHAGTYSTRLQDHTPEQFSKDGFIIATFGKEGAIKIAEIAAQFEENPYIHGYNISKTDHTELLQVSVLGKGAGYLRVDGTLYDTNFGMYRFSYSFGLLK